MTAGMRCCLVEAAAISGALPREHGENGAFFLPVEDGNAQQVLRNVGLRESDGGAEDIDLGLSINNCSRDCNY